MGPGWIKGKWAANPANMVDSSSSSVIPG